MIRITQWLCPQRHCSLALAWDEGETDKVDIEARGEAIFKEILNRWCGICRGDLHMEHSPSIFKTMAEAMPHLIELQVANNAARRILQGRN